MQLLGLDKCTFEDCSHRVFRDFCNTLYLIINWLYNCNSCRLPYSMNFCHVGQFFQVKCKCHMLKVQSMTAALFISKILIHGLNLCWNLPYMRYWLINRRRKRRVWCSVMTSATFYIYDNKIIYFYNNAKHYTCCKDVIPPHMRTQEFCGWNRRFLLQSLFQYIFLFMFLWV
jgi:hypothetical protein